MSITLDSTIESLDVVRHSLCEESVCDFCTNEMRASGEGERAFFLFSNYIFFFVGGMKRLRTPCIPFSLALN